MLHKNVLVIAVGGGSDSVSALLAIESLKEQDLLNAERIDILCVLPSVVDYMSVKQVSSNLWKIAPDSYRMINGRAIPLIDSSTAAIGPQIVSELQHVFGVSLKHGSDGVFAGLQYLNKMHRYDKVWAIDVGGDFIAVAKNDVVLSPMMDGMIGHALRKLEHSMNIEYAVFGLGTDGESTTEMLDEALRTVNAEEHTLDHFVVKRFDAVYRSQIEPIRYARTLDYLLSEAMNPHNPHPNPSPFRARFVCKFSPDAEAQVHYGYFSHYIDRKFWNKFYVFYTIESVDNPFIIECKSELEWFLRVQSAIAQYNCELNGQFLPLDQVGLSDATVFMATPSCIFSESQKETIIHQTLTAIKDNELALAITYEHYIDPEFVTQSDMHVLSLPRGLCIVAKSKNLSKAEALHQVCTELHGQGT